MRFDLDMQILRYMQVRRLVSMLYLLSKRMDLINEYVSLRNGTLQTLTEDPALRKN